MGRILVISPHPDDESIGCGGTLRAHVVAGDRVHVSFLTSGERGGHGSSPEHTGRLREAEAAAAAAILEIDQVEFWREPDGALRASDAVVARLRLRIRELKPEVIYVPHDREMHSDHRAAARMVRRVVTDLNGGPARPSVFMFEVWTPLAHLDHVVDISPHIEVKLAAVRAHASQCGVMRFDEAVRGLNRYRGEMHSWPGGDYAEAFARLSP
jgi:N-acetylglucosamine malate deacetylase 1